MKNKVKKYSEYFKSVAIINNAPENLIIKDRGDLKKKILEGIEACENEKISTIEEAFKEVGEILSE